MKLYECKRGDKVRLVADTQVPPGAPEVQEGEIYVLHDIDGMYSYCTDSKGDVVHLVAWAEVEKV